MTVSRADVARFKDDPEYGRGRAGDAAIAYVRKRLLEKRAAAIRKGKAFHRVFSAFVKKSKEVRRRPLADRVLPGLPRNKMFRKWLLTLLHWIEKSGFVVDASEHPLYCVDARTRRRCKFVPDLILAHMDNGTPGVQDGLTPETAKVYAVGDLKTGARKIFTAFSGRMGNNTHRDLIKNRGQHIDQMCGYLAVLNGPHAEGEYPRGRQAWASLVNNVHYATQSDVKPRRSPVDGLYRIYTQAFLFYTACEKIVTVDKDFLWRMQHGDVPSDPAPSEDAERTLTLQSELHAMLDA